MIEWECKTLHHGRISIRSYDRKKWMDNKETVVISHKGKKMTLTPVQVKTKIKAKSALYTTQHKGGEDYYLYFYKWNPDLKQD